MRKKAYRERETFVKNIFYDKLCKLFLLSHKLKIHSIHHSLDSSSIAHPFLPPLRENSALEPFCTQFIIYSELATIEKFMQYSLKIYDLFNNIHEAQIQRARGGKSGFNLNSRI